MAPLPHPHHSTEPDRDWLCRCLEETTANLRDLHLLRQEAEKRVREALNLDKEEWVVRGRPVPDQNLQNPASVIYGTTKSEQNSDKKMVRRGRPKQNHETDQVRSERSKAGLDHVEVPIVRPRRIKSEQDDLVQPRHLTDIPDQNEEHLDLVMSGKTCPEQNQEKKFISYGRMVQRQDQETHITKLDHEDAIQVKPRRTKKRESQEEMDRFRYRIPELEENQETMCKARPARTESEQVTDEAQRARNSKTEPVDQNREWAPSRELPLSVFPDNPGLYRIGSGSWVPRLRLGSSGVTSDLLFTRRMSGNCLSTPSSGFYEASDLDSASSCSSLCSEASSSTPFSMISPRTSTLRPKSTDCTAERRKELQSGRVTTQRPMSAGALDSFFLLSLYNSKPDNATQKDDITHLHAPPPLSVIHQRRRTERYICKLALKYRCRPGVSTLLPDLGPPIRRSIASLPLQPESPLRAPQSPRCSSLSSSVCDVRRINRGYGGSWGRFLSRVMLRRDPRTAASEMHLEQCGRGPHDALQIPPSPEGQLVRAKSFKDLLSVNPFKRSQRGLNKSWTIHA
ncbi:uncharacterized protein O3C94_021759 [Discoglossus pictus]